MVPVYLAWLQSPRDATQATYLAEHWSELVPFVAASARLPEAAIASAYGGHCISLFIAAIEANLDFTHGSALVVHGMAGAELASKVFGPGPQP